MDLSTVNDVLKGIDRMIGHTWSSNYYSLHNSIQKATARIAVVMPHLKKHAKDINFDKFTVTTQSMVLAQHFNTFHKYIKLSALPSDVVHSYAIAYPKKMKKVIDLNKLPSDVIDQMIVTNPVIAHDLKLPLHKLNANTWPILLQHNIYSINDMLDVIPAVRNKTTVRNWVKVAPSILMLLTPVILEKSCLTTKEWIVLLKHKEIVESGYTYTDDIKAWLDLEFSIDVLSGNETATRHTRCIRD